MTDVLDLDRVELADLSVSVDCEAQLDREDPADQPLFWRAELRHRDLDSDRLTVLATADLWTLNPEGESPTIALEATTADLARYVEFFVDDELDPALDLGSFTGGIVIADRVSVPNAWRRRGFGPLLLAEALTILGDGRDVALCEPAPFEVKPDQPEWTVERARLQKLWGDFGFEEWRSGLWFLDLATTSLGEMRERMHARIKK